MGKCSNFSSCVFFCEVANNANRFSRCGPHCGKWSMLLATMRKYVQIRIFEYLYEFKTICKITLGFQSGALKSWGETSRRTVPLNLRRTDQQVSTSSYRIFKNVCTVWNVVFIIQSFYWKPIVAVGWWLDMNVRSENGKWRWAVGVQEGWKFGSKNGKWRWAVVMKVGCKGRK